MVELTVGVPLTGGLWTRTASILRAGAMAYAYFFTHVPTGWNPVKNGGGFAATLCWDSCYLP